jgi:hypothetical protein
MSRYKTEIKPEVEKFYSRLELGKRCLAGQTLIYFIRNMSLYGLSNIKTVECEKSIRVRPRDSERTMINIPYPIGAALDKESSMWDEWPQFGNVEDGFKGLSYAPRTINGVFMTEERKRNAHELIAGMLKCGEEAGIADKMFLGFGGVLGHALIGDLLWNDDDVDMCILADDIPQEQLKTYLTALMREGHSSHRLSGPEMIGGKYTWFSIGNKPQDQSGCKACNWFWFKHKDYYWHAKDKNWLPNAAAKGIPSSIFTGKLKYVQFGPNRIQVPEYVGCCLDWWYGDWIEERGVCSAGKVLLKIQDENDRSTWKIIKKDVE